MENGSRLPGILRMLIHILVLGFFCVMLSLPGFTSAAAIASMYYVMLKLARGEDCSPVHAYFHFFGENFVKSIPYGIAMLVIRGLLYIPLIVQRLSWDPERALIALLTVLILAVNLFFAWVLLLFAQFDNTVVNTVSNAVRLAMANPMQSLVIFIVNGVMPVFFVISAEVFAYLSAAWLLFGIGTAGYLSAKQAVPVFDALIRAKGNDDPVTEVIEHAEDETGEISL